MAEKRRTEAFISVPLLTSFRALKATNIPKMIMTIIVYPLVVVVAYFVFGIRRAAPGETGSKGQLI